MDPVVESDQVWDAWWQEKEDEVVDMSRCRIAVHNRSLGSSVEIGSGRAEKLRCRETRSRIAGLTLRGRGLR
jgi:hypothetical protein